MPAAVRFCARLILVAAVVLLPCAAIAQLAPPTVKPIIGARMPSLSPDGKRLAFVYKGDVWVADAAGGRATALTRNVEFDGHPLFSPDGKWVAFSSNRTGHWDVFVVPATGGEVKRLTWHSNGQIATGWSPDGTSLVFASRRDTSDPALLSIDVATLRLNKLAQDYFWMSEANYSPDGKSLVYGRNGFPWTRPRYNGSGSLRLWLLDIAKGTRRAIADDDRQHLWPRFMPDGKHILTVTVGEATPSSRSVHETRPVRFVDSPARTPNLWLVSLAGGERQLTRFIGGSVRCPAVAAKTGDIAFEYEHDLWLLKAGDKEPRRISLVASQDDAHTTFRNEMLTAGATEGRPSPDGKSLAFALKGDLWTIPIEKPKGSEGRDKDIARRLTTWAGDDSDVFWSQDGKKLYFRSDRDTNTKVFEMDAESLRTRSIWSRPEEVGRLTMSPDGKQLAFWATCGERGLYVLPLDTRKPRRLLRVPEDLRGWQGGGDITWSPDMKWIAFVWSEANGARNIWIVHADGGAPVNVTRLNATHSMPAWSPDGRYLFFRSNREGGSGTRVNLERGTPGSRARTGGLYVLPLKAEPGLPGEIEIKFEKPKDFATVEIDFADTSRRIRRLSSQDPESGLTVSDQGAIYYLSEGDLWHVSYDGKETKRLTTGGGRSHLTVTKDGKKAYVVKGDELYSIPLRSVASAGADEKIAFRVEWSHDVRADRLAAFIQFWRAYNQRFYDPNLHQRDWLAIRKRYEPLLVAVETREEFSTLLAMMVGELDASHSEIGPAPGGTPGQTTPHLGFTFDYTYLGPGIRVDKVPAYSPCSFAQSRIRPGEYVMTVNGKPAILAETLFRDITDKQGRVFELLVNAKPSKVGARLVRYASPSWGEWHDLTYRNRIERLRRTVEERSDGTIGYVHISGMGAANRQAFEREFYEYSLGKEAMIIDVRFNGGGNISDSLLDWIERKPHGYYRNRDTEAVTAPGTAWDRPIVILMNEHSMSNAEMFPNAMRARGLATLVGMPTPGYVIWTGRLLLSDGTSARMPGGGIFRLDGSPMENLGEKPDVRVSMTAEDWLAERDPQLDKALELLRRRIAPRS